MRSCRWVCLGVVALGASLPAVAFGQASAAADTLFEKAVGHMKVGEFAAACPLLDQSLRLDARDGTLFTLANCRDREGKMATALGHYRKYLRAFAAMTGTTREKHVERAAIAESRVKELAAEVPSLKMVWSGGMPANTKILLDGAEVPAALDIVWELDPGEHRVEVMRAGAAPDTRVVVLERKKPTVLVDLTPKAAHGPTLPGGDGEAPSSTNVGVPGQTIGDVDKPPPDAPGASNVRRTSGFVALGVGGAGLLLGGVMGGLALSQKGTVDSECKAVSVGYDCSPAGRAAVDEIVKYGTPSTVGFIAGGVLAATGLVLILTAPKKEARTSLQVTAQGAPGLAFVNMEGSF